MSDAYVQRIVPHEMDLSDPEQNKLLAPFIRRVEFAGCFAHGKRVLNCACGSGFGSRILKDSFGAEHVTGLDFDTKWVDIAREHYQVEGTTFDVVEQSDITFSQEFDLVMSHETLKYRKDPADLLRRFHTALKPGGELVSSIYTTPTTDFNPYHYRDITYGAFKRMLKRTGFRVLYEYWHYIDFTPGDALSKAAKKEPRDEDFRRKESIFIYYLKHPVKALNRIRSLIVDGFTVKNLTVRAVRI